jgi:hypothetical protein
MEKKRKEKRAKEKKMKENEASAADLMMDFSIALEFGV